MNLNSRHLLKAITWRIIGTMDTLVLAYILIGSIRIGFMISIVEILTKTLLYFYHEKFWFKSTVIKSRKRHMYKTFSWRFIATCDTIFLGFIFTSNLVIGFKFGGLELLTKMFLYYIHERVWYRISFGLDKHRRIKTNSRLKSK